MNRKKKRSGWCGKMAVNKKTGHKPALKPNLPFLNLEYGYFGIVYFFTGSA
jgi:hypothetical protein